MMMFDRITKWQIARFLHSELSYYDCLSVYSILNLVMHAGSFLAIYLITYVQTHTRKSGILAELEYQIN